MSDPSLKYIIPKLSNVVNYESILTDNFCVVGCDSSIEYDGEIPILGNTKPLAYTYDGVNYIPSSNTTLYYISKVDFNGYQWIAVGCDTNYTQSIILSSDGINWVTPVNNVIPDYIIDVAWGKKKWVAFGVNDSIYRFAYSSDGMNWTSSNYNNDGHVSFFNCIAFNGTYFLAGGYNRIAKSTDGNTWTDVDVTNIIGSVNSITWNGHIWVAGGTNASAIGYSYDGVSWTAVNNINVLLNSCNTIVYNGTKFLAGGIGNYKLVSSQDGINWTGVMLHINETYLPGNITDITWNGTYWIVVNSTNNYTDPKIAYSSDLVNWYSSTSGNTLFNGIQNINTITSRNRKNYINAFTS